MKTPARSSIGLWLAALFFVVVIAAHVNFAITGWHHSVGGPQDFRQAQTAIAAHYIAEEGPMLATKVPVLGPTWRIPLEFPTYQTVVAALHSLTGAGLDPTGRFVSLASFYLCLLPLALILRRLGFGLPEQLLTLALVAASPIYLFWSRAFLIESMALLLALLFAAAALQFAVTARRGWLVLAIAAGALAAVTKFTTFSIAFGFVLLWAGASLLSEHFEVRWRGRVIGGIAAALLVPVLAGLLWSQYLQHTWVQSPLTRTMGDAIHAWNFGTWKQRVSPEFWARFSEYAIGKSTLNFLPWLAGFSAFALAPLRWRLTGLCAFAAWLSGPLVWANLFFLHDYYYYATTAFGLIWIAAGLIGLGARWPVLAIPARLALALIAVAMLLAYPKTSYHEAQVFDWGIEKAEFAREVGKLVEPDDVILVIGEDWNPMMAYYANRHALMVRWDGHSTDKEFANAVALIRAEGRRFAGLIVRMDNPALERELERVFHQFDVSPQATLFSRNRDFAWYPIAD
jgi:hypothetical protein